MRTIKFRAWNQSRGVERMLVWGHLKQEPFEELIADHLVLMQFTGLLDKNGKEIYEGDILTGKSSTGRDKYWTMVWADRGCWEASPNNEYNINWKGWEVIGNIYENPELLNP